MFRSYRVWFVFLMGACFGCSESSTGTGVPLELSGDVLSLSDAGGELPPGAGEGTVRVPVEEIPSGQEVDAGKPQVEEEDTSIVAAVPLEFDPPVLDFGVIPVGTDFVQGSVTVRNPGFDPVDVVNIQKSANEPTFLLAVTSMFLYGKGEDNLSVLVNPGEVGIYEETLVFLGEGGLVLGELELLVTVAPPECEDIDGDLHGKGCPEGDDCNEADPNLYEGAVEVCDDQDNDCDGLPDEDYVGKGNICQGGLGECITEGTLVCNDAGTGLICSADVTAGGQELCNGIDDDCDGATDETFPDFNAPCFSGVGACERLGKLVCSEDGLKLVCNVAPGEPALEECFDEIDNDCDGVLDEGEIEICGDGIDNDCDDLIDESGSDWGEVFLARNWRSESIAIYPSNGDGTFEESYLLEFPDTNYYSVAGVGDFDGDLYLDLVALQTVTLGKQVCKGTEDCAAGYVCKYNVCSENCQATGECTIEGETCVDINYNSNPEDTICLPPKKVFLVQKGCEEELKMTELFTVDPGESVGRPIDADGNGHLDFLSLGHHSTAKGVLWLNDGNMGYSRVDNVFDYSALLTWKYTLGETSRDFTGDGLVDVVGARFTSGGNPPTELFLIEGKGDGTFLDPVQLSQKFPYPANLITANDFDRDGDQDLVGGLDDDGQPGGAWMLIQDTGDFLPSYPIFDVAPNMNSGSEKPGFGNGASFDFNGDDYPDVLVAFAPEECGNYVWGCTQVTDEADVCYGGDCRKLAYIENRTGNPCGEGEGCIEGTCVAECVPQCDNLECGGDGCYGSCGTCEGGQVCSKGKCVVECIPDCADRTCGDNGCGGVCGYCEEQGTCVDGACVSGCIPNCNGKECGDDGCGGVCTVFGEPQVIAFNQNSSLRVVVPTNVPPTQPQIDILPADALAGDSLECVISEASLDLDPVSYEFRWFRDGIFAKDVGNVAVIPAGKVLAGETWLCEARGTDGLESSVPATSERLIGEGE